MDSLILSARERAVSYTPLDVYKRQPKEIRRTLRLREGTPLEIFTDREGEIILKKYSPMVCLLYTSRCV